MRTFTGLTEAEVGGDAVLYSWDLVRQHEEVLGGKARVKTATKKRLNKQLARSKLQTAHFSMTAAREGRSWRAGERARLRRTEA